MTVSDPIADMLARIKNALAVKKAETTIPWSKIKYGILQILAKEGYINDVSVTEENGFKVLKVELKYDKKQPSIKHIRRISKPGKRVYINKDSIPYTLNGLGMSIISTSKGLKSDKQARRAKIGGELICEIW